MSTVLQPRAPTHKRPAPKLMPKPRQIQRMPKKNVDEFMRLTGALKGTFPDE